jgi:hypothetical protein
VAQQHLVDYQPGIDRLLPPGTVSDQQGFNRGVTIARATSSG